MLCIFGAGFWILLLYALQKYSGKLPDACPAVMMQALVCLLPFLWGGFYLWSSAFASVLLTAILCITVKKQKALVVRWNIGMCVCLLVSLAYLITGLWGVDAGGGLTGFVKFFPLFLFYLALMQFKEQEREGCLAVLPVSGALMVAVSCICAMIPALRSIFLVNHRLAGFFQYPNSFAVFLLCLAIYIPKTPHKPAIKYAIFGILIVGIVMSGSRTALVIGVVIGVIEAARYASRPIFRKRLGLALSLAVLVTLAILLLPNSTILERLTVLPTQSSTFLGRLLYAKDALMQIVRHPFGLGYGGYYFAQGSFQTGVYAQRFVHNELLQLLIDIGWIPTIAACVFLCRAFWKSKAENRLMMLALLGHALFDFDFQFLSLIFLLLLAGHKAVEETGWHRPQKTVAPVLLPAAGAVLSLGICMAICDTAYYAGHWDVALYFNPLHTEAKISFLTTQDDADILDQLADHILRDNQNVSIAYSAKANAAFSRGSGQDFIKYKLQAISLAPYQIEEYEDFTVKLYQLSRLYEEHGMTESAEYCVKYLFSVPGMLEDVKESTSPLAWKITDKPQLEPTEVMTQILGMYSYYP